MEKPDPKLLANAADALDIHHPALVEKDYYAVQLLKHIRQVDVPEYQLVFAGGTCLAKAHKNTYRMSEDVDIKLVANPETLQRSRSEQRKLRDRAYQSIIEITQGLELLKIRVKPKKRNEGRYQQFLIDYPRDQNDVSVLRPYLQFEITESALFQESVIKPIKSLYAEAYNQPCEIPECDCVAVESIAAEKFVSLLRRTALVARDSSRRDDEALVRHVYDLHLILSSSEKRDLITSMIEQVIEIDLEQFGNQHPEFVKDPKGELRFGLQSLKDNPLHRERYQRFIGPLVYHPNPPVWELALSSLERLAAEVL